ncbi:hypothetical protein VRRI112168_19735 [Vreelandella rituensis]|uniref:Uncharacterized protein n=1 Tax=Vreelandella rituensis TaxID=2282306 RepID=A0A368TMM3_9GAMM|nr:hypothetical protein [Halomonas rituensis]RCV85770.1 hypothetical protein DU506_20425 [Halomonas rituensis]
MSRQYIHPVAEAPLQDLLKHKAANGETFTVCELRDRLGERPEFADFDPKRLCKYVREQIYKRVEQGVVEQVGTKGKCRKVFQLTAVVNAGLEEMPHDTTCDANVTMSLVTQLNRDSDALRDKMEAHMQQLQTLKEMATQYPDIRDTIASLFDEKEAQAKALNEKLIIYAEVRQRLVQQGGKA